MAVRQLKLRYDDHCSVCASPTPAATTAWWDSSAKHVTCTDCMDRAAGPQPLPPPRPIEVGEAGTSAQREAERLRRVHDRRAADLDDDAAPDRTTRWVDRTATNFGTGAEGEQRVGAVLESLADVGAVVLHDRSAPNTRGNIDHLVVAPSGVWIVDAKKWTGRVERRTRPRTYEDLLYVKGRNRTSAAEAMRWQVEAVRAALDPIGFGEAPVTAVLCFTGATWGLFARPFKVAGVLVTWPDKLVATIRKHPTADPTLVSLIAHQLSTQLPAKH